MSKCKSKTGHAFPPPYYNPDAKCWFNALMALLTVFKPLRDMISSTDKNGPVCEMLRLHFSNPPFHRQQVDQVDTDRVVYQLRKAIMDHQEIMPSRHGEELLDMLNGSDYHDPGEAWNCLHGLLREELDLDRDSNVIGVHVKESLTCTRCHTARFKEGDELEDFYHALQLNSLTTARKPSVQTALQQFFSPEKDVEARCCRGSQNVAHEKFYECCRGDQGMVFYGPFDPENLKRYRNTKFVIDNEIRLPFEGPASGMQSSYELIGFTARYVDAAHHVAVIYDNKGNPWTFDDYNKQTNISRGLPKRLGNWVPVLMFYELWAPRVETEDVHFPTACTKVTHMRNLSPTTNPDSDASARPSPQNSPIQSRRASKKTNFYRPPNEDPKPRSQPPKQAQQQKQPKKKNGTAGTQQQSGNKINSPADTPTTRRDATTTPPSAPAEQPRDSHDENAANGQPNSQLTQQTPQNDLADKYPADTWVWVKQKDAYLAARIVQPQTPGSMRIQWANTSQVQHVRNNRILRKLELREERIVFALSNDQGRNLTLAKIESLLKSQGGLSNLRTPMLTQEGELHDESYSGLAFTEATVNWDSLALPWLLSADSSFCPTALIGQPFSLPSKVPYECFSANQEFTAHPSFGNCFREVALIMQQVQADSKLYQLLFAWIHLLPVILLRAADSCSPKALSTLISRRCTQFLQGEWASLYTQAVKDVSKINTRAIRQQPSGTATLATRDKVQRANKCIRRGNLSKGARILTGNGVSKDPNAYNEMVAKHPQDVSPAIFPSDYTPPPVPEFKEQELEWLLSTANLARVAGAFPAESHPDQWGWRPREYISPLLHDPGVGELVVETLIRPRYEGKLPKLYGECYRGGKLIALSKAPKPGSRPIAIGDTFRRILDKALQPFSKKELAHMFEHSYSNVKQFASGSCDGAEKFIVAVLLALQEDPAPAEPPDTVEEDPNAAVLLDMENAFNKLRRQVVVDMTTGDFERTYAQGRLTKDNITVLPDVFAVHIPSIRGHYEGDGRLVFVDGLGQSHEVISRTGTQQGCVLGGKLFNIGTFSVIGATLADHPDVFCPMFSDNIALVGKLSKVLKAAEDLRLSLQEIDLNLQPADSAVYIPSYIHRDEPPQLLQSLQEQYPHFRNTPWSKEGIVLLGCPVGTDDFVQGRLEKICHKIEQCVEQFANVDDGLIHLQLHKFSVNAMLPYFLRTTNPALAAPYAQQIDALIWNALLDFSEVSPQDRNDTALQDIFQDARRQVAQRIGDGGFGITPNECVAVPAFYSAVSRALRFAAGCGFTPIQDFLASAEFLATPLCVSYVKARSDLIHCGAKEPEAEATSSQAADTPADGEADTAGRKKKKPVILPKLEDIIAHTGDKELFFPDQKVLTRLAQKSHPHWSADGLTDEGKARTKHLSKQTIKAQGTENETAVYLQGIGNFDEEQELYHSPLAFLTHTESLVERYPKDLFAVLFSYLLGLPAPSCLQRRGTSRCEACNQPLDMFGHHRMTCKSTAAYHSAHTQLASAFAEIARKSGVPYTDKGVPSHLTTNKVGDALCNLSSDCRQLIMDYTVVHPRYGTPNAAGQWNPDALSRAARHKWNRHGRPYAIIGFAFAPCVMSTYGQMEPNFLRLLYILARKRANLVHVHHRPFCNIDSLFGRFFAQSRARIGAAVARGMALRALGSSMLGVSKVFLKHIAPARYRDQTLSAGPHLAAGHTQWRLTLSV